jgi:hypothetical protein
MLNPGWPADVVTRRSRPADAAAEATAISRTAADRAGDLKVTPIVRPRPDR